jgi:hypothetical protein
MRCRLGLQHVEVETELHQRDRMMIRHMQTHRGELSSYRIMSGDGLCGRFLYGYRPSVRQPADILGPAIRIRSRHMTLLVAYPKADRSCANDTTFQES